MTFFVWEVTHSGEKLPKGRSAQEIRMAHKSTDKEVPGCYHKALCPRARPSRFPRLTRRRQYESRITPDRVRMRKHHNKWQRTRRKRWQQLLNGYQHPERRKVKGFDGLYISF